jgi:GAF domain-containing protein
MFKWIKNYFTLPVFEDDEQTRRARLLISILAPLAVVTVVMVGIMVVLNGVPSRFADASPIIAAVLIVVATLVSFPLARRRFPYELAIVILTLIFGVTTLWLWFTDGLSGGYASFTYVLVIVLAGMLLGPRGAVTYTFLSLIGIFGAAYAENQGLLPGRTGIDVINILILSTVVALTGVFLRYTMRSMQDAIDRARRLAQAQAEANRELEAIRLSLEERVAARTQDLQSRSTLLLTALELGRAAASLRDLDQLLSQMPGMIAEQVGFYHVGLFLMDQRREAVVLRGANSPEGRQMLAENYYVAVNDPSFLSTVVVKQELRVAVDVGPDTVSFANSPFPRTRSQLTLPLMAGNRPIGALDLHSAESDVLTDQMIEVMRLLADQLAIAVESAQLFAESQAARAAELRAYGAVSREAWREMTRAEGAEGGLRFLSDAPGVIRPASGDRPAIMQQARQTGRVVTEANSTLAVPIQIREGVNIGALRLNKSTWGEDEIALVETLTEQLGAALESARLYQETQRREARERITREITDDIRRSVDMEVILKTAVSNLGEALGVPRTYVRLMLGAEAPGSEPPGDSSPAETLTDEKSLVGEPPAETWTDQESPGEDSPVEDTDDSPETSAKLPDASAVAGDGRNFAGGEEHDEP